MGYLFEMPRAFTFDMPKVRRWLEDRLYGQVLNVFQGKNKLSSTPEYDVVNCDIDETMHPDFVIDAMTLADHFNPQSFDVAVMDPPYSYHQANVNYKGHNCHKLSVVKDHLRSIVRGSIIWFGWSIPATEGFGKVEILLVSHGGSHNATICTVENRVVPYVKPLKENCANKWKNQ
jgi:hypothetical protein